MTHSLTPHVKGERLSFDFSGRLAFIQCVRACRTGEGDLDFILLRIALILTAFYYHWQNFRFLLHKIFRMLYFLSVHWSRKEG